MLVLSTCLLQLALRAYMLTAVFLFVLAAFSSGLPLQTETGKIVGTVTDLTGAVIADEDVRKKRVDTSAQRQVGLSERPIPGSTRFFIGLVASMAVFSVGVVNLEKTNRGSRHLTANKEALMLASTSAERWL